MRYYSEALGSNPSSFSAPSARASALRVYVVLGDGEINAGMIWEGAMTAAKYRWQSGPGRSALP
jgi:transketolase